MWKRPWGGRFHFQKRERTQVPENAYSNEKPARHQTGSHTATIAKLFKLLPGACRNAAGLLEAATITVTERGDTIAVDGLVTLAEAITSANNNADVTDVVAVGAYGTGYDQLQHLGHGSSHDCTVSALPTITDPVIIDGYTQPGSAANTQAVEDDAVLLIELNGADSLDANGPHDHGRQASTIRGLVINRLLTGASGSARSAIALSGGGGNVIEGNFLGTDAPARLTSL